MFPLLLVCLASLGTVHSSKILLLPNPEDNSPIFLFRSIYDELQNRGHDAYFFITGDDVPKLTSKDGGANIKHITYQIKSADLAGIARKNYSPAKTTNLALAAWIAECDDLLSNTSNFAQLEANKPDIIMGIPFFPCTAMLAVKLGVPYITVNPAGLTGNSFASPLWEGSGRDSGIAPHIATVPEMFADVLGPMTFWERMRNAWAFVEAQANDYLVTRPLLLAMQRKHGIDLTTPEARRLEVLHVISGDMALEVPRPLPPNVKLVGPINPKPAKPLPADLEEFVDGAGEAGVALISLGTMAQFGREDILTVASALARLPARTIWKLTKQEVAAAGGLEALNLTDNVKVVNWVPQNDVLGHPCTRAFLSHCGANGMYEAAYHGVPVVAMPFYGDQPLNARKLISKGTAVMLLRQGLTAEGVSNAFTRVLTDDSYRAAAAKLSKRIRSRKRTPLQEAADLVEHVLDSDGEPYLQLPDQHLHFFIRNSFDVIAAHLGAAILSLSAAVYLSWRVVGRAYRKMQWLAGSKHKVI